MLLQMAIFYNIRDHYSAIKKKGMQCSSEWLQYGRDNGPFP